MHDAAGVRFAKAKAGLVDDVARPLGVEAVVEVVKLVERLALQQLHEHEDVAVSVEARIEDGDHVRIGQLAQDGDLPKRPSGFVVAVDWVSAQLERQRLLVARVLDPPDRAKASLTQASQDLVVLVLIARAQVHGCGSYAN